VTLKEDLVQPALPPLRDDLPRTDPANSAIVAQRRDLLQHFAEQRSASHRALLARLKNHVTIKESFTPANLVVVTASRAAVRELFELPEVLYIEFCTNGERPPQAQQRRTGDGRAMIGTDYWTYGVFPSQGSLNAAWERIGLMDSGVRTSHVLLQGRIASAYDCFNTTGNLCVTSGAGINVGDVGIGEGHGTASAAIISGNASLGVAYKGVSFYQINSYRVYNDASILDFPSVIRAIATAQQNGDQILVAEMQADSSSDHGIAAAADAAVTSTGISIVAAAGNVPDCPSHPCSPANARNVVAVGSVTIPTGVPSSTAA